ncbi:chloride channel protein [Pendulispora rubella]|uniref:Chloride channel protein n=1 Tax=Pendulispora rubella TaxID=2741070 RepID=A0ABZ2L3Z6_9BACT
MPPSPLDLQLLGRMLLHSALVGAAAGLAGTLFFATLEFVTTLTLEHLAGYNPLRAHGEQLIGEVASPLPFRPWLLWAIPAIGALAAGIISARCAPETLGGGSDAIIHAFHHQGGHVRRRVPFIKGLVSVFTLGSGGSGGREGPTMLIGGSIGSIIGRYLRVSDRERRILLVAGTAAGMAAVFRTPLGAALLAVEVLHRDDFESDAVVPAVLSSVVAYSVFISFFGESTLFAHAVRYPFVPVHLPLYALMAILVSLVAAGFAGALHGVQHYTKALPLPAWSKPALGGLLLGASATPVIMLVAPSVGAEGQGLGILGGGYGAAQVAITGASWFPEGWRGVELLLLLGLVKILATSLTVGSGGSAGDFGPSLVIGGIFGGAFGRAASLVLHDPRIDPGAFALVGMATFYGGLAHVPIASLVMTCELAGSYDLLVPLMLAEGIAFVALRNRSLYHAQVPTKRESPAHRDDLIFDVLKEIRVGDVVIKDRPFISFRRDTPAREVIRQIASTAWQDAFPVLDEHGKLAGIVNAEVMRTMAADPDLSGLALADDMMAAPVSVHQADDLHVALELLLSNDARELIVLDDGGRIIGFLDEAEITKTYHGRTATKPVAMEKPKPKAH